MVTKKRGKKKGISPLIATVLLISFTVVLIVLVVIWGKNYIAEKAEKEGTLSQLRLKCVSDVRIKVVDVRKDAVDLENLGSVDIESFNFRAKVDGKIEPDNGLDGLPVGKTETFYFDDQAIEVDIIPQLRPDGRGAPRIPCTDQHVVIKP